MSRRCHHGSPRHARTGRPPRRPAGTEAEPRRTTVEAEPRPAAPDLEPRPRPEAASESAPIAASTPASPAVPPSMVDGPPPVRSAPPARIAPHRPAALSAPAQSSAVQPPADAEAGAVDRGATGPQLRRFIKSRAYVPMHELRRRFAINGQDDEVTPVDVDRHRVFVGLPEREGRLLGELLRGGDIGYELSLDPITPIVVGVYPMRPVTRP